MTRSLEYRRSYLRAAYRAPGQGSFDLGTTAITPPLEDRCDVASVQTAVNRTPETSLHLGKTKGGLPTKNAAASLSQGE